MNADYEGSEGPRPAHLSTDVIVDACIALGDREGAEAVTLRRLGAELGVHPTAVYRHFRDKDEIFAAVADRLLWGVLEAFRPVGGWREDLRALILGTRGVYFAHPRLAHVLAASPDVLPSNQRIAEIAFGALLGLGLDERETAIAFEALENYTAGSSSLDAEVGTDVVAAWRRSFATLAPEEFPNSVAVAPHLYRDDEAAFAFGLDLMLDAIQARTKGARG